MNRMETQNDPMLTQIASQMVENQYSFTKTALQKACDLEVHNELRNEWVHLSLFEQNPNFLDGETSIANFSHFPNIGRSATVNFRHEQGELGGSRDGDSEWNGGSNWGGSGGENGNNEGEDDFLHLVIDFVLYSLLFLLVLKIFF